MRKVLNQNMLTVRGAFGTNRALQRGGDHYRSMTVRILARITLILAAFFALSSAESDAQAHVSFSFDSQLD